MSLSNMHVNNNFGCFVLSIFASSLWLMLPEQLESLLLLASGVYILFSDNARVVRCYMILFAILL